MHTPDRVQFIGHASVWITLDDRHFIVDANFSPRVLGVLKRHAPVGIDLAALPEFSGLLVTHAHYDHLDLFSYKYFPQNAPIISPSGVKSLIERFLNHPVHELKTWESYQAGSVTITAVPTQHFGFRVSGLRYTRCNGYILKGSKHTIYLPGDTAYGPHFAEIGRRFEIDAACLPIGAYHPRWIFQKQHMDPADAIQAFKDLKAKKLIPIHWGSFKLTFEPLSEPLQQIKALSQLEFVNDSLAVLQPGERLEL